jgi:hypothetical protein
MAAPSGSLPVFGAEYGLFQRLHQHLGCYDNGARGLFEARQCASSAEVASWCFCLSSVPCPVIYARLGRLTLAIASPSPSSIFFRIVLLPGPQRVIDVMTTQSVASKENDYDDLHD